MLRSPIARCALVALVAASCAGSAEVPTAATVERSAMIERSRGSESPAAPDAPATTVARARVSGDPAIPEAFELELDGGEVSPVVTFPAQVVLATLRAGDEGPAVRALQELLNRVLLAGLVPDGRFGPATTAAVSEFQDFAWLPVTGEADHATQVLLAAFGDRPSAPAVPAPTVGNGSFPGCQVSVVGDSLMAGATALHRDALAEIGCAADVDGVGGRSLSRGWQCRVRDGGGTMLKLLDEPQPGNATCSPSGLELLERWAAAGGLGDLVVVALGTNDAGVHRESTWVAHWEAALRIAGDRPVLFLTSQARPGDRRLDAQRSYSAALRGWCATTTRCLLADWAMSPIALDPASYVDGVHLTREATVARARFIRDAVAAAMALVPPTPAIATTTSVPPTPTTTTTMPTSTTTSTPTSTTVAGDG